MDTKDQKEIMNYLTRKIDSLEQENEQLKNDYKTLIEFVWNINIAVKNNYDAILSHIKKSDDILGIKTDLNL